MEEIGQQIELSKNEKRRQCGGCERIAEYVIAVDNKTAYLPNYAMLKI